MSKTCPKAPKPLHRSRSITMPVEKAPCVPLPFWFVSRAHEDMIDRSQRAVSVFDQASLELIVARIDRLRSIRRAGAIGLQLPHLVARDRVKKRVGRLIVRKRGGER